MNKLGDKVYGSDFNPAVFLAEGKESFDMIASNVTSLATAIRKVKHGDMRGAARALGVSPPRKNKPMAKSADEASGRWLELQYGWLPLLGDTKSAAEHVASLIERPHSLSFKATKQRGSFNNAVYNNYVYAATTRVDRRTMKVILQTLPNPSKLNLLDPAIVAWELLPYSFVADWFLPIGDYLSAQKIRSALPVTKVITSQKYTRKRVVAG